MTRTPHQREPPTEEHPDRCRECGRRLGCGYLCDDRIAADAVPRVVIAQCTATKRDHMAPAEQLYDESAYFRRQREYARARGDVWFVQSALHGLLAPYEVVEPYNRQPTDIDDVDEWAADIADDLEARVESPAVVELLGGKAYADPLTPELEARGYDVIEPLRGLRIGSRRGELKAKTQEARP